MATHSYDIAIVGAGILGLAHALAAARLGLRVVVIDRDAQANGASVRNFGFVTVTGQEAGDCWLKARRSRDVWAEVARAARIPVLHEGLLVTARRPEAEEVIDAFLQTRMGEACRRLTASEARKRCAPLRENTVTSALWSPHELRVESRAAIPRLAEWLEEVHGVTFLWRTAVHGVDTPWVATSRGPVQAAAVIVCPGDDTATLFADRLAGFGVTRCKLNMLRLTPRTPVRLGQAVMSDLGLARYLGYARLPAARALARRLDAEQPDQRVNGIHLITVQSGDGSLVVGDSHHYDPTPDPFQDQAVNRLILDEFETVLDVGEYDVTETWIGTYASAPDRWRITDVPEPATRLVVVTAGCGASTAFAIGEETLYDITGKDPAA